MTNPIIVFDLDGTLIDTAPDLLDSLNYCLEGAGLNRVGENAFRSLVGMGGKVMIERAYQSQNRPLPEGEFAQIHARFLEHYSSHMPGRSQPFPGVLSAMDRLEEAGFILAVCTNKYYDLSKVLLDKLSLSPRFKAICGSDTFEFRKPDPRHLTQTILQAGGDVDQAVLIGDSKTDIDTAKNAGIPVVAVDFGYSDRHVKNYDPSRIISHFDELSVDMVRKLIAAAQ